MVVLGDREEVDCLVRVVLGRVEAHRLEVDLEGVACLETVAVAEHLVLLVACLAPRLLAVLEACSGVVEALLQEEQGLELQRHLRTRCSDRSREEVLEVLLEAKMPLKIKKMQTLADYLGVVKTSWQQLP